MRLAFTPGHAQGCVSGEVCVVVAAREPAWGRQAWPGDASDFPKGGGSRRVGFVTLLESTRLSDSLVLPEGGGVWRMGAGDVCSELSWGGEVWL